MENELSHKVIGASIEVHRVLGGPGLLESIYSEALHHELLLRGMLVKRNVAVSVTYKDVTIKHPLFLDFLIDDKIIIEVKATDRDNPIFYNQLLTYLRLTGLKLGLLINFGNVQIKDGLQRVVNGL